MVSQCLPVERPTVEMIARFGWKKLQAGETVSPEGLEANYLRRSDAETVCEKQLLAFGS